MAQQQQKNTRVKAPQKPMISLPPRPFAPPFQKPVFGKQKSFTTAFRTQSKGGGGK